MLGESAFAEMLLHLLPDGSLCACATNVIAPLTSCSVLVQLNAHAAVAFHKANQDKDDGASYRTRIGSSELIA